MNSKTLILSCPLVSGKDVEVETPKLYSSGLVFKTPLVKQPELAMNLLSEIMARKHPEGNALRFKSLNFKLENMQNEGSFKIRGIIPMLENIDKKKTIIVMSCGNFGRSVSAYCGKQGIKCKVIMPDNVPVDRIKKNEAYGSEVILVPNKLLNSEVEKQLSLNKNSVFLHPYNDLSLIRGIGSLGKEVYEQNPETDLVVCGVGGGGLISGIGAMLNWLNPNIELVGVEPEGANKMCKSLETGKPFKLSKVKSFVTGLSTPDVGHINLEHVKEYVDDVVLVSDDSVKLAMKVLYEDFKIIAEPAAAAPLAAIIENKLNVEGKNVTLVISGGNISMEQLDCVLKEAEEILETNYGL